MALKPLTKANSLFSKSWPDLTVKQIMLREGYSEQEIDEAILKHYQLQKKNKRKKE